MCIQGVASLLLHGLFFFLTWLVMPRARGALSGSRGWGTGARRGWGGSLLVFLSSCSAASETCVRLPGPQARDSLSWGWRLRSPGHTGPPPPPWISRSVGCPQQHMGLSDGTGPPLDGRQHPGPRSQWPPGARGPQSGEAAGSLVLSP